MFRSNIWHLSSGSENKPRKKVACESRWEIEPLAFTLVSCLAYKKKGICFSEQPLTFNGRQGVISQKAVVFFWILNYECFIMSERFARKVSGGKYTNLQPSQFWTLYRRPVSYLKKTTCRRLVSISVFRWILFSWALSQETSTCDCVLLSRYHLKMEIEFSLRNAVL
jgi:hypothetical protein